MNPESIGNHPPEIRVNDTVSLRGLTVTDSEALFDLIDHNREHLSQNEDVTASHYPNLESVRDRTDNQKPEEHRFGIWDGTTLVGFIKLTEQTDDPVEIGYWLGSEYQGHGYMAMSVEAMTDYAVHQLGYASVIAKVNKQNSASLKVLTGANYAVMGNVHDNPDEFLLSYYPMSPEEKDERRAMGYLELAEEIGHWGLLNFGPNTTLGDVTRLIDTAMVDAIRRKRVPTGRDEAAIRLRYGLDDGIRRTLQSTGEIVGISKERVRQVIKRGALLIQLRIREIQSE